MLQETSLVEGCQGIDSALDQSQLLHVVVYVEVIRDLFPTLGQDPCESCRFASQYANDSLKYQDKSITEALCHADALLGRFTSLSKQELRVFTLQSIDCLRLPVLCRINLEQIPNDCQMHQPRDPELEEKTRNEDQSKESTASQCNYMDKEQPVTPMHCALKIMTGLEQNLRFDRGLRQWESIRRRLDLLVNTNPFKLVDTCELEFVLFLLSLFVVELMVRKGDQV